MTEHTIISSGRIARKQPMPRLGFATDGHGAGIFFFPAYWALKNLSLFGLPHHDRRFVAAANRITEFYGSLSPIKFHVFDQFLNNPDGAKPRKLCGNVENIHPITQGVNV